MREHQVKILRVKSKRRNSLQVKREQQRLLRKLVKKNAETEEIFPYRQIDQGDFSEDDIDVLQSDEDFLKSEFDKDYSFHRFLRLEKMNKTTLIKECHFLQSRVESLEKNVSLLQQRSFEFEQMHQYESIKNQILLETIQNLRQEMRRNRQENRDDDVFQEDQSILQSSDVVLRRLSSNLSDDTGYESQEG